MKQISSPSNFYFCSHLIALLKTQGLSFFCICSGSRNTPLTLAAAENKTIDKKTFYDERAACFYALGYAMAKKEPAAVITTSGSAIANLFPAVVEAFESNIPLLLLTADRPQELRNTNANQTIDQEKFFGSYTHFYASLSVSKEKSFLQQITYKLFSLLKGPCHINLSFEEPLFTEETFQDPVQAPIQTFSPQPLFFEKIRLPPSKKGIILIGKEETKNLNPIFLLAEKLRWPVISDILSQVKTRKKKASSINYAPFFLSSSFSPEVVLHFGERFVEKKLFAFLQKNPPFYYAHICDTASFYNPYSLVTHRFFCSSSLFCNALSVKKEKDSTWLNQWIQEDIIWSKKLSFEKGFTEPFILQKFSESIPKKSLLFLGNSLSIRHADQRMKENPFLSQIYANRGSSGIDGNIATALGISQGEKKKVLAILGDLTSLYDLNSFSLVKEHSYPILFLILNNQGGNIFEMLPVKKSKHLNKYIKMNHPWNFREIAKAFSIPYFSISTEKELKKLPFLLKKEKKAIIEFFTKDKSFPKTTKKT